jgi:hypothetical protein
MADPCVADVGNCFQICRLAADILTEGVPLVRRLSVELTHCHKNRLVTKCYTDLRLGWILWIDLTMENGLANINNLH